MPAKKRRDHSILTVNTGSSSLKAAVYQAGEAEQLRYSILADRIGHPNGRFKVVDSGGIIVCDRDTAFSSHEAALDATLAWLRQHDLEDGLAAVGHRIVHGGAKYRAPQVITEDLLRSLERLVPIDPEHLPQALAAIALVAQRLPDVIQVACFDTSFHSTMPPVAQRYALPRRFFEAGVMRYGFHGLSNQFILEELRAIDPGAARGRVIVAHLGNGASMTAIRNGASVDTTMGFSPTGGLVMSTRSGDLDPSVPLFLERSMGLSHDDIARLLNTQAGLLGVSETTADMRQLLELEAADERAAEAIALFCYQAKKFLGSLAAILGGLDTLVFTGGIGENAALIRSRICEGLDFLGIHLDGDRNADHAPVISAEGSPVTVRVIPTNEDVVIARATFQLLTRGASDVRV